MRLKRTEKPEWQGRLTPSQEKLAVKNLVHQLSPVTIWGKRIIGVLGIVIIVTSIIKFHDLNPALMLKGVILGTLATIIAAITEPHLIMRARIRRTYDLRNAKERYKRRKTTYERKTNNKIVNLLLKPVEKQMIRSASLQLWCLKQIRPYSLSLLVFFVINLFMEPRGMLWNGIKARISHWIYEQIATSKHGPQIATNTISIAMHELAMYRMHKKKKNSIHDFYIQMRQLDKTVRAEDLSMGLAISTNIRDLDEFVSRFGKYANQMLKRLSKEKKKKVNHDEKET